MKILRQVEIDVIFFPIFFAQSMLSSGQCFSACFQICWEVKILRQVEIGVISIPILFRSIYAIFWSYEKHTPKLRLPVGQF